MPLLPLIPGVGMGGSPGASVETGQPAIAPEIYFGPPVPGSPWESRARREWFLPPPPESLPQPQVYPQEIYAGPPLPGAPWFKVYDPGNVFVSPPVVSEPAESPFGEGDPLLARDPPTDPRLRRLTETLSEMINSLSVTGQVAKVGASSWRLCVSLISGAAPTASNDETLGHYPGEVWVHTGAGEVYICISAAEDAAVWRKLAFEE